MPSGFFEDVDLIVPVPLHKKRQSARGYNQSEWIARGISEATGIPVCTELLECVTDRQSQTHKGIYERWLSTHESFTALPDVIPAESHVLLVDDVVTTGATLLACGKALAASGISRISICALSLAK